MQEIKLKVKDENLETLLSILNNLKEGLISDIDTNTKVRKSNYRPKVNKIVLEEESGTADKSGKYINPATYKRRLQK